jgi:hypothetical protein
MPRKDKDLLAWMKNFLKVVLMYLAKWKVAAIEADDMNDKIGRFETAMDVVESKLHTQQDVDKKNIVKKEAVDAVRLFVNYHINGNPNVTFDQRRVCGLTVHDKIPTRAPLPHTFPVLKELIQRIKACIEIQAVDSESGKKSKPDHVQGVEVIFWIGPKPAEHIRELLRSLYMTHMSFSIQLTDDESTQYFSFSMRYENTRGEKGPWSPIYHVVIS